MTTRVPVMTIGLAVAAAVAALSPAVDDALHYERAALAHGEVWRGLTGHLVHWDARHFGWDVLAVLLCGHAAESISRRAFAIVAFGSALAGSMVIFVFAPDCLAYRGLSGISSGLFVFSAAAFIHRGREFQHGGLVALGALGLLLFVVKTGLELAGTSMFLGTAGSGYVSMPLVHLAGCVVGGATALTPWCARQSPPAGMPHAIQRATPPERRRRPATGAGSTS